MAETENNKPSEVDKNLERGGIPAIAPKTNKQEPVYKVIGQSKIPVSKSMGKVWKARRNQASAKRKSTGLEDSWDEALNYYYNDQQSHRSEGDGSVAGNRRHARKLNDKMSETENIVFANVNAIVPSLYAKNPNCEVTAIDEADEPLGDLAEDLLNAMLSRKGAPGVNIKPKAKRAVVMAALTNRAYLEYGWTFREQSSDQALKDLQSLSDTLAKASSQKEILEVEGALMALEQKVDLLRPEGAWVKFRRPHEVLVDPDGTEDDLTDHNFILIADFLATDYLRAVFGTKRPDGQWDSIYQPTHVLKVNGKSGSDVEEDVNNFTLIDDEEKNAATNYGFDDVSSYEKAQRTKVWWVWDKVTRRVMLFNDKDWTWPIWVWDDPYHLDKFFPLEPLSFYTSPEGGESKGEVTYYLDQQDAVNEMNDEERRARYWAKRNIVYNTRYIKEEDAKKFLNGPDGSATGISLPEGVKITDAIFSMVPPSMQFTQLFDPSRKIASIDRIASVSDVLRGAQFKTNTTNDAIEYYQSNQATRLDERIDAIEDMLTGVCWGLLQMAFQFMSKEAVAELVGERKAAAWINMDAVTIRKKFQATLAGGSTVKPTSNVKKKEALQITQLLGQFASASPYAMVIGLKVLERSFEEIVVTDQDWQMISQSIMAVLQRGNSTGQGAPASDPSSDPRVQQAVQALVQQGMPEEEARQQVLARMQQQ